MPPLRASRFLVALLALVVSSLFALGAPVSGQVTYANDWSKVTAKVERSIFRVEGFEDGYARPWTCTAVMVGEQLFLTAAHCIPDNGYNTVGQIKAELLRVDHSIDLALLSAPLGQKSGKVMKIRTTPLKRGTQIAIIGYAFGAPAPKATYGWVSDPEGSIPLGGAYGAMTGAWFDMTIIGGHSGGPVFDTDGRLVSIAQASLSDRGSYLAFGPTPMTVRLFLLAYLGSAK